MCETNSTSVLMFAQCCTYSEKSRTGGVDVREGGRGFPEPSKAEQRPGPLPVLLLLSRLDILVKLSNNAEFSLGSCFYHLFKG